MVTFRQAGYDNYKMTVVTGRQMLLTQPREIVSDANYMDALYALMYGYGAKACTVY